MSKHVFVGIVCALVFWMNPIRSQSLGPKTEVSILTFGPSDEVYALWGHTAIWIHDDSLNIDKVYNYGVFDFQTPNFLIKFLRGKLNYTLGVNEYSVVHRAYKREKRSINQQLLHLSPSQKSRLYSLLETNYKPKNRYYKYDFFYDNCATRPLAMIENSLEHTLDFKHKPPAKTYRDLLDEHLIAHPWVDFGIDLIIGAKADSITSPRQQMFLPIYIYRYFDDATLVNSQERIVENDTILLGTDRKETRVPFYYYPAFIMMILLLMEIVLFLNRKWQKSKCVLWYDRLWFGVVFLSSVLIVLLWFATDHGATKNNWNLIWANPLFLLLVFKGMLPTKLLRRLMILLLISAVGTIAFWNVIPQSFHIGILPIVLILLLKILRIYRNLESRES